MNNHQLFRRFYPYVRKYYKQELLILVLILLANAGSLSFPYFLKIIVDKIFPSKDIQLLVWILLVIFGIHLITSVIGTLGDYLKQRVTNNIMKDLRMDLFEHIIHLPIDFYNKNDVGDMVHRLGSEINSIMYFLSTSFHRVTNNLIILFGVLIILFFLNSTLFFISILLLPMLMITVRLFHFRLKMMIANSRKADSAVLSFMIEKINNLVLIKLFNAYKQDLNKFNGRLDRYVHTNMRMTFLSSFGNHTSILIISLAPLVVIGFGSVDIFLGSMTLGTLIAFLEYFNKLFGPSRNMIALYYETLGALESMRRITDFLEKPTQSSGLPINNRVNVGEIALERLSLQIGDVTILNSISMHFKKGTSYGIVGESGSGKTSLTYVICGLYPEFEGKFLINNIEENSTDVFFLNNNISLVSSKTRIINGTIRDNILYGINDTSDDEIWNMLRIVRIDKLIEEMEDGIDTEIRDLSSQLSDGQRQRLAIARALLKNTDVLIMDEATSALDSTSESLIMKRIRAIYSSKILIVISHRLSSILDMNKIICIRGGKVIEEGTHDSLNHSNGYYFEIYKDQLSAVSN